MTTMNNKLYNTDHEARLNFVIWYLHREHAGEIDPHSVCLVVKLGLILVNM